MKHQIMTLLAAVTARRYLDHAPPSPAPARPYLVLRGITGKFDYHASGPSGYRVSRVQIDIFADTPALAEAMLESVVAVLSGYRGGTIQGVFLDAHPAPDREAADPNELSRRAIDAIVHHVAA